MDSNNEHEEQNEEEEQKDEQEEKESSLDPSGTLAIPYQLLLAHMLGLPLEQTQQILQGYQSILVVQTSSNGSDLLPPSSPRDLPPSSPLSTTESDDDEPSQKRQKLHHPPSMLVGKYYREYTEYNYLLLSSGREFYFNASDEDVLLTPQSVEQHPFIRKLVLRIPSSLKEGLLYLSDFLNDDNNMVVDVDRIAEEVETPNEAQTLDLSTIFTNLREQLISAYLRERRLRRAFRTVLQRWRMYRINKKYTPEVDPITLSPVEKEVVVYDLSVRKKFVFEARSLANYMEIKLGYNEGGFAAPIFPKNPWTNADFTYYQLLSIYYQLKAHGELRWGLITLQKYHFDLHKWHQYHRSTLTLQSIKNSLRLLDSVDARDILEDFILLKLEDFNVDVSDYVIDAYRIAMRNDPNHWYLQYWKEMAWIHYEADHFSRNRTRYINTRCEKIIRHHRRFLNELVERKWIRPPSS